jgi:hypothetical protein
LGLITGLIGIGLPGVWAAVGVCCPAASSARGTRIGATSVAMVLSLSWNTDGVPDGRSEVIKALIPRKQDSPGKTVVCSVILRTAGSLVPDRLT